MKVSLDQLKTMVADLKAAMSAAIEADPDNETIVDAIVQSLTDTTSDDGDGSTSDDGTGAGAASDGTTEADMAAKKKEAAAVPAPTQMSDNPKMKAMELALADGQKKIKDMEIQLKDSAFTAKWVGQKITPAQKVQYFNLFLKDEKNVKEILDGMPTLTDYTKELGTGTDINMSDVNPHNAKTIFEAKVKEMKLADKTLKYADAVNQIYLSDRKLYDLAYPSLQTKGKKN